MGCKGRVCPQSEDIERFARLNLQKLKMWILEEDSRVDPGGWGEVGD